MKATHVVVEEIIKKSPFLEEALAEGIINLSSLSRQIKPEIDEQLHKRCSSRSNCYGFKEAITKI